MEETNQGREHKKRIEEMLHYEKDSIDYKKRIEQLFGFDKP